MSTSAIETLKSSLGSGGWLEGSDAQSFERDERGLYGGKSLLVARPRSTEEVSEVVKVCAQNAICIVPQGGNTGLCGGSVPIGDKPSIILSLSRMNRIISVDPERFTATVEAGCILQAVHDAAEANNRRFGMDWGARGSATIGGGISTNAGGLNVLKFGPTRDQVLGLEVVMADGRIWNGLRSLRKDSSGYDLKHLFIGAEGTLGIVTKAVLKLYPRPEHETSMFMTLSDITRLNECYGLARAQLGDKLTAFELLPGPFMEMALKRNSALRRPIETKSEWYILLRAAGTAAIKSDLIDFFQNAESSGLTEDATVAEAEAHERSFWNIRDEVSPLKQLGSKLLKWDTAVPIDRMTEFFFAAHRVATAVNPQLKVYAYGHVGDGNWHMSVGPTEGMSPEDFAQASPSVIRKLDELIWEFGGTISAEHGIGVENLKRVVDQRSQVEREWMAAIKTLFDPNGLFNPGKLIDPTAVTSAAFIRHQ
jgi:FAD/FMN-containing dehydrogenase